MQWLIVLNTYTANLAAILTGESLRSGVKGVEDLRGKAVVTIPIYKDRLLKSYGISALADGMRINVFQCAPAYLKFLCRARFCMSACIVALQSVTPLG